MSSKPEILLLFKKFFIDHSANEFLNGILKPYILVLIIILSLLFDANFIILKYNYENNKTTLH